MADPRWTIDEDGLVRWRGLHAVAALNEDNDDCFEAYDALVAAVHDADTLRQARELRDLLMKLPVDHLDGKWVSRYVALLDLLAPVSDTPTPDDTHTETA